MARKFDLKQGMAFHEAGHLVSFLALGGDPELCISYLCFELGQVRCEMVGQLQDDPRVTACGPVANLAYRIYCRYGYPGKTSASLMRQCTDPNFVFIGAMDDLRKLNALDTGMKRIVLEDSVDLVRRNWQWILEVGKELQ